MNVVMKKVFEKLKSCMLNRTEYYLTMNNKIC